LAAWYWGVRLGRGCRFLGRTHFRREADAVIEIGEGCEFRSARWSNWVGLVRPCSIGALRPGARVTIGARAGMSGTVIAAAERIEIGDDVLCGANVTITDADWHGLAPDERRRPGATAPVRIEDNVWLGLNVIVLKGVTIGRDSVIGAGSVVARSIPSGVIAAGQPAKVIRELRGGE
jgi:acetyltransferase-like isoleucine patch superfamily enzyme